MKNIDFVLSSETCDLSDNGTKAIKSAIDAVKKMIDDGHINYHEEEDGTYTASLEMEII